MARMILDRTFAVISIEELATLDDLP